jgi:hypothetical protein
MKKLIIASALMLSLFGISYGIASALDAQGVVAKAACTDANCD